MGKANLDVQIPGAPAPTAGTEPDPSQPDPATAGAAPDDASAAQLAEKDAEIARLRAVLAAKEGSAEPMVIEGGAQNTARYKAESKHRHLTSAELHAKVMKGEVSLTDHHVLCKDGWYCNPAAQAHANG